MRKFIILLLLGACGWVGWGWWSAHLSRIDPDDGAQVAMGREVYARVCAECHGTRLQGEADWQNRRPTGELPAPPHDESGHTWHHSDEYLFAVTKYGVARFAPVDYKTNMPAYVGKLTDDQIRAVLAFIKSGWSADIRARQEGLNRR